MPRCVDFSGSDLHKVVGCFVEGGEGGGEREVGREGAGGGDEVYVCGGDGGVEDEVVGEGVAARVFCVFFCADRGVRGDRWGGDGWGDW